MVDLPHKDCEEPDSLPVNERSTSFIEGVAFLDFVRLKSLVAAQDDRGMPQPPKQAVPDVKPSPQPSPSMGDEIEIEDWDSLFGAVEERLRDTAEKLDSETASSAAQGRVSRVKSMVLDCVSSLDMLHKALRLERKKHTSTHAKGATADDRLAP